MICFEVWLNGKKIKTIGHKDALILNADIMFHRENKEQYLNLFSSVWRKEVEGKDLFWSTPNLSLGDEVIIKIVETDKPDFPDHEHMEGVKLPPPWGGDKNRCSFCGKTEDGVELLFDGLEAKICNECIEFKNRIYLESKKQKNT